MLKHRLHYPLLIVLALSPSYPAIAVESHYSIEFGYERIDAQTDTLVANPTLLASHEIGLSNKSNLRISWQLAPSKQNASGIERLYAEPEINFSDIRVYGEQDSIYWNIGIQPIFFGYPAALPSSIYSADFLQEHSQINQLAISLGYNFGQAKLEASLFKNSPWDTLHFDLNRKRHGPRWQSDLGNTDSPSSVNINLSGVANQNHQWSINYTHLASDLDAVLNSDLLMGAYVGSFNDLRLQAEVGVFQNNRGYPVDSISTLLGLVKTVGQHNFSLGLGYRAPSNDDTPVIRERLIELAYQTHLTNNLSFTLGISTLFEDKSSQRAFGLIIDYQL